MSIMKRLLLILILLLPQLLAAQSADRSAVQSVDRTAAQTADRIPAVPAVNMPSEPWTAIRWGSTPCGGSMRWAAT